MVTALKDSLANSAHAWVVASVTDTDVPTGLTAVDDNLVLATSQVRTITLRATGLSVDSGSSVPLILAYDSVWTSGAYVRGDFRAGGGQWRTTDSALDTTIRALAATFLSDRDTRLIAALGASTYPDTLPSNVLTALKASLADSSAGWNVRHVVKVPNGIGIEVSVTLVAAEPRIPAGTSLPAQVSYTASLNPKGDLLEARVLISGSHWRVKDAALHTTIMTLATAFQTAQQAAIVAGLEA